MCVCVCVFVKPHQVKRKPVKAVFYIPKIKNKNVDDDNMNKFGHFNTTDRSIEWYSNYEKQHNWPAQWLHRLTLT